MGKEAGPVAIAHPGCPSEIVMAYWAKDESRYWGSDASRMPYPCDKRLSWRRIELMTSDGGVVGVLPDVEIFGTGMIKALCKVIDKQLEDLAQRGR